MLGKVSTTPPSQSKRESESSAPVLGVRASTRSCIYLLAVHAWSPASSCPQRHGGRIVLHNQLPCPACPFLPPLLTPWWRCPFVLVKGSADQGLMWTLVMGEPLIYS